MGSPRTLAVAAVCALCLGACSGGDEQRGLDALDTPQFAPDEASGADDTAPDAVEDPGPASTMPATTEADRGSAVSTTTAAPGGGAPAAPQRQVVSFDDPVGDAVGGLDDDPPPWSDLAGAQLTRNGDAFGLSIRLGGGTVPQQAPDGRTMNVATFFDIDGDGSVDYEIWVNLGPEGWAAAYYDNVDGGGGFGEESNVTVVPRAQSLELVFPDVLVQQVDRLRFSLASEYGGLDVLGSDFARRDDAPDGDRAVAFPD